MRIKRSSTTTRRPPPGGGPGPTPWRADAGVAVRVHERLSAAETAENFTYVLEDPAHGNSDPVELVDRVRRGVKPMATLVVREGGGGRRVTLIRERPLRRAATGMGLACEGFSLRGGRRVAVVFQPLKTLSRYYPPDETIARYQAAGVRLERRLFFTPLESLARDVAAEDFAPDVRLPTMGLCLGYPVHETLSALGWQQGARVAGA